METLKITKSLICLIKLRTLESKILKHNHDNLAVFRTCDWPT